MTAKLQPLIIGAGMALRSGVAATYDVALPGLVAGCPRRLQNLVRQHAPHRARASPSAPRWGRLGRRQRNH